MKTVLMAAATLAVLGLAAPAFADAPASTTVTINGTVPAQCSVTTDATSVTLDTNAISTTSGFINPALAASVAAKLNGHVTAWCSGNHNTVVLSRTALITGAGATDNGFAQGAIYDLQIAIDAATRGDGWPVLEDTGDGAGNGPHDVTHFGGTGTGAAVVFAPQALSTPSAVTNGAAGGQGNTGTFTPTSARLVAGEYTGSVTLTLSPGL